MNIEVLIDIFCTLRFTHTVDLNGSTIEVLEKPPSPLEFSRLVHISRPVIIKGIYILFILPSKSKEPEDLAGRI